MKRSTRTTWHVVALVCATALLAACSARPDAPLELTQRESGTTQAIAVGQELHVTLLANPSTGYTWAVDGDVPAQLEQVGEPEYTVESSALGSGGSEVWTFLGKAQGEGVLKLKYWRSFEPTAAPEGTFEVTVDVR